MEFKYHEGCIGFESTTFCTWAKSNKLNFSVGNTILPYHIITILMHIDTQDKSLYTPRYLSMAWETIIFNCHHKQVYSWYSESRLSWVNIFTKTENKKSSYQRPLARSLRQISSLLPFICMTKCCDNNSARIPWTKPESARQFFTKEKTR